MDLALSLEQAVLRETLASFVDREILPNAVAWDQAGTVDLDIVPRLGELGVFGITIPEEYGGAGGDHLQDRLMLEGPGRGDPAVRGVGAVALGPVAKAPRP